MILLDERQVRHRVHCEPHVPRCHGHLLTVRRDRQSGFVIPNSGKAYFLDNSINVQRRAGSIGFGTVSGKRCVGVDLFGRK